MSIPSRVGRLLAYLSALFFASVEASALQYQLLPLEPQRVGITVTGPIVAGDFDRLQTFMKTLPPSDRVLSFFIDSPGGSISEASKIAELINSTGTAVTIPSGSQCSSACFLLFAAASRRAMAPDALIGVHSVSEGGHENLTAMGFTTAFARVAAMYGVPPAIIGKMVQTEPGRMAWLAPSDLESMGVIVLTPSSPEARPVPTTPPPLAPRPRPQPAAQSGERLIFVTPVSGAPGDGRNSLAAALRDYLSAGGVKLASGPDENVYTVQGSVSLGTPGWRSQSIRVDWEVFDPSGKRLGTVSQDNTIPPGSLNGSWGPIAKAAAREAVDGVIKILKR